MKPAAAKKGCDCKSWAPLLRADWKHHSHSHWCDMLLRPQSVFCVSVAVATPDDCCRVLLLILVLLRLLTARSAWDVPVDHCRDVHAVGHGRRATPLGCCQGAKHQLLLPLLFQALMALDRGRSSSHKFVSVLNKSRSVGGVVSRKQLTI